MFLFTRTSTFKPERSVDAAGWAVDIAAQVSSITGVRISTWSALYGAPLNTVTWSCRVESHAEMGAVGEKLMADPGYTARIPEAAELFEGAPTDALIDVVAMVGDGGHTGSYASVVSAQCAGGKIAAAMTWGVEIFNHVGSVTGRDGIFGRAMYGPWATLGWISLADSLDEVDAAQAAMSADPRYIEMIDEAGDLFLPGSGQGRLSQRIG
ncbi:hypothetical protein ACE2AJ_17615 [Aquihabitans daechungensis]|uniref:hypothetical protein n=1 Tax=Aquihabitans daechungensis TaxID=1052257 RepID=UPI003B9FE188